MGAYEDLLEFLAPFAEGADGYIGFTRADRSQDPADNKGWGEFHNWYGSSGQGEVDLSFEVLSENPRWEYYFTPAVLTEENRRQSKFSHSNVIWIDFDKPVEWAEFDPAPSIVVQTSEEKFHCYWLLREPITNPNDMRYWNSRFVHFFGDDDEADKSGIDATQLLKLPWGLNLKLGSRNEDGTPWAPKVIKFNTSLRYGEADFINIPEPPVQQDSVVDLDGIGGAPEVEKGYRGYLEEYGKQIPKKLQEKILAPQEGGEEKRSGALYNLICELFDALTDPTKVFEILLGSPNDKFSADHGGRGADLLWKDINRVCSKRANRERVAPKIASEISDILKDKDLSRDEQEQQIAEYVMDKLRNTGEFLLDSHGTKYYADKKTGESVTLYDVTSNSDGRFVSIIVRKRYNMLQGTNAKRISNIAHEAISECLEKTPLAFHHFAHYDPMDNLVYVDRYDGTMYVLDGETVEPKPHGYNNVYFYPTYSEFPRTFEYLPDYTPGGLDALILDGPNYTTQGNGISREGIHHLLKTWITAFFFPEMMDTRPIILIHGAADSGKTTFFQTLSILLTGDSSLAVTDMPENAKEFDKLVTQNSYLFYDNVEVNKKELQRKLAQVATGYTVKERKLYTNNEMLNDKARSFVGITSRTVDRIQEDVVGRYVVLPVHPFSAKTDERRPLNLILKDVVKSRDELWSELLDFVNATIREVGRHGLGRGTVKIRMAEYGALLDLTCGITSHSYPKLENFIRSQQTHVVSENDPLFAAFQEMVEAIDHDPEKRYRSKELLDALTRINRKVQAKHPTANKFTRDLQAYINNEQLERYGVQVTLHRSGNNTTFSVANMR